MADILERAAAEQPKGKQIHIKLTDAMLRELMSASKKLNVSQAWFVRDALAEHIKRAKEAK